MLGVAREEIHPANSWRRKWRSEAADLAGCGDRHTKFGNDTRYDYPRPRTNDVLGAQQRAGEAESHQTVGHMLSMAQCGPSQTWP